MDKKNMAAFATAPDLAVGRPGAQLNLGLTKTMINIARQLSRSLLGIYH